MLTKVELIEYEEDIYIFLSNGQSLVRDSVETSSSDKIFKSLIDLAMCALQQTIM